MSETYKITESVGLWCGYRRCSRLLKTVASHDRRYNDVSSLAPRVQERSSTAAPRAAVYTSCNKSSVSWVLFPKSLTDTSFFNPFHLRLSSGFWQVMHPSGCLTRKQDVTEVIYEYEHDNLLLNGCRKRIEAKIRTKWECFENVHKIFVGFKYISKGYKQIFTKRDM